MTRCGLLAVVVALALGGCVGQAKTKPDGTISQPAGGGLLVHNDLNNSVGGPNGTSSVIDVEGASRVGMDSTHDLSVAIPDRSGDGALTLLTRTTVTEPDGTVTLTEQFPVTWKLFSLNPGNTTWGEFTLTMGQDRGITIKEFGLDFALVQRERNVAIVRALEAQEKISAEQAKTLIEAINSAEDLGASIVARLLGAP